MQINRTEKRKIIIKNTRLYHTDVNAKSSMDGTTPLHIAARYNCPDVAEVLLQYGADVTDVLKANGQTPLHVCCRRGFLKVAKVFGWLFQ